MPTLRRLLLAASALAVIVALLAVPGASAGADRPAAAASKKKGGKGGKKPGCKKGYVAKKVKNKKGKKAWKCVKKPPKPCRTASASCAIPPPPPKGIFEAPGRQLNGEEAKPFLQKYLVNSTFTDCPAGWPSCGGFEDRYSHSADGTFYMCLLKISSGSDVKSVGTATVTNARVEPDGSWIVQEVVSWYGYQSAFEWSVSATGVVNGAYQSTAGSGTPEKIGPLTYVGGVAKDCSY